MNTAERPMYKWKDLPWQEIERAVFKLQKRIYRASQRGDTKTVHKLQRLLMKSWAAKCLTVRRVTQDNQGKKTAGVDGVKSLTPIQRIALVEDLNLDQKTQPTRRVWIPKPGAKDERRGLGIPTIANRALQALVKLALEPEWEAKFEPNSYGFRPGRAGQDAIAAIFNAIHSKAKFVLDADITKCFDRIQHEALIEKLATFPVFNRIIRSWLKAGIMEGNQLFSTTAGTPQGSIVSPLLANIALHGLETAIKTAITTLNLPKGKKLSKREPTVIRYADDFVILHEDLTVIEKCKQVTQEWLGDLDLELKPSKTSISHTLHKHEGKVGFNFLGWTIRQFPVGKTHSGFDTRHHPLSFKTIIKPAKEALSRHLVKLKEVIGQHKAKPQHLLIKRLNPIIRGWSNYFMNGVSKATFYKADHLTYQKLQSWAKHRHPNKSGHWRSRKYWHTIGNNHWTFASAKGEVLYQHSQTPIVRYVKVKERRSPFDGDWVYWSSRLGHYPGVSAREAKLLKEQKGKCSWCKLYFKDSDLLEIDHIIPKAKGGKDGYGNQQILHRHCHDKKTHQDKLGVLEVPMTKVIQLRSGMR
jgi:RNA-directed DNA polymerase